MKLLICGHARHGKDTFCNLLGLEFSSSSLHIMEKAIWPKIGYQYHNKKECFEDRVRKRELWFNLTNIYNHPDETRIAREILSKNDIYCGMRNRDEFLAVEEAGLFDLSIWVDASKRHPPESDKSCTILRSDCDIVVDNNGSEWELKVKAEKLKGFLGLSEKNDVGKLITNWADDVFPHRTISNAIQKLVLEEIPEYLINQKDPMELADVGILVYDIANLAGVDLNKAIRDKMAINKKRTWKIDDETGLMKHIPKESAK